MAMVRSPSGSLALFDHDNVGEQEEDDDGEIEEQARERDDAPADQLEVIEEAHRSDRIDDERGRPAPKEAKNELETAHDEQEADRRRDDEGDHLVLGERRHARSDREK